MNCPKCTTALQPHTIEGVPARECPDCRGLWLEGEAFEAAKDHAAPDASWLEFEAWKDTARFQASPSQKACPSCSKSMAQLRYGDSAHSLEYCSACHGLWLDAGDFESILAALGEELSGMSTKDVLSASLHEALNLVKNPGSALTEWHDLSHLLRLLETRVLAEHPTLRGLVLGIQRGNPFD